jgi:hypothetical protein
VGDGASGSTKLSRPASLLLAASKAVLRRAVLRLWPGVRQMQIDDPKLPTDHDLAMVRKVTLDLTNFTDVKQPVPREIFVDVPVGIFLDVANATFTKQPVPKAPDDGAGVAVSIHSDLANATFTKQPVPKARGEGAKISKTVPNRRQQAAKPLATASVSAAQDTGPPQAFAFVLACFAKPGRSDEILGDAEAEYHQMATRFGPVAGRWWYRLRVARTICELLPGIAARILVLLKLGLW